MSTKLEVRCCCDAGKLLGWLRVPPSFDPGKQRDITVPLLPGRLYLRVNAPCAVARPKDVTLPIGIYWPGGGEAYPAISSDGVPVSVLRRVYGFEEAV